MCSFAAASDNIEFPATRGWCMRLWSGGNS